MVKIDQAKFKSMKTKSDLFTRIKVKGRCYQIEVVKNLVNFI